MKLMFRLVIALVAVASTNAMYGIDKGNTKTLKDRFEKKTPAQPAQAQRPKADECDFKEFCKRFPKVNAEDKPGCPVGCTTTCRLATKKYGAATKTVQADVDAACQKPGGMKELIAKWHAGEGGKAATQALAQSVGAASGAKMEAKEHECDEFKSKGKFEIFKGKNGEFYFRLKAGNNKIILSSEGYKAKDGAENGIKSVKTNSQRSISFQKKESKNKKWFFNLKAANGKVVGTSQMYESTQARDNGITSVKCNAKDAQIVNLAAQSGLRHVSK